MVKREFQPSVRYINGLRIYFKSKHTVQVSTGDVAINITRWAIKRNGVYEDTWYPFCKKLCRTNGLNTIWDVMDIAQKYGLDMMSARNGPDKLPDGIKVRPSKFDWSYKNGNI